MTDQTATVTAADLAGLTCSYDVSSRTSSRPSACKLPAVSALRTTRGYGDDQRTAYEPRCKKHAAAATRSSMTVLPLDAEIAGSILREIAAAAAVKAEQRARRNEEQATWLAWATAEEQRVSTLRYRAISEPDSKSNWDVRDADGRPTIISIPRWRIVQADADGAARDLFDSTVGIGESLGEPRIEARISSRLTPSQARAVIAALAAALNEMDA